MALILDMPMQDDAASTAVDDVSASNNNGTATLLTNLLTTTGPGGTLTKALAFNGTTTKVTLTTPIAISTSDARCLQFFAKRTNTASDDAVVGDSGGDGRIYFAASTDDVLITDDGATSITCTAGTNTANWHHYALVFNGDGTVTLYVDGLLVGDFNNPLDQGVTFNQIGMGAGSGQPFVGSLCLDNALYNTTRTQPQIATDKEIGLPTPAAPTITSNGGGSTASVSVVENTTAVTTVVATGDATITFSKTGGADQSKFTLTGAVLTFTSAPNFEAPTDANTDNVYVVEVTATNGAGSDIQTISVTVTDAAAPANVTPPVFRGVGLVGTALTASDGTWTNSPTITYAWDLADNRSGTGSAAIVGQTTASYAPVAGDVGKSVRRRTIGSNVEGGATVNGPWIPCYAVVSKTFPPYGVDDLATLSAFDGKFLYNETLLDTNQAVPGSLSYKNQSPQNGYDWTPVAAGHNGVTGSGATRISSTFAVMAEHSNPAVGGTLQWVNASNSIVQVTIAETWNISGDATLVRLSSAPSGVGVMMMLGDSSTLDGVTMLGVECDRHLNVLTIGSLDNSTATVGFTPTTADVIEAFDSGKPGLVVVDGRLALAMTAFYTSASGPNPGYYLPEILAVLGGFGETVTASSNASGASGGAASPGRPAGPSPIMYNPALFQ